MVRSDFTLRVGDTLPSIEAQLLENGDPIDLSNAAVVFQMDSQTDNKYIEGFCAVTDPDSASVAYTWDETDTDTAGTYEAVFGIDYSDPSNLDTVDIDETFPPDENLLIEIKPAVRHR